MNMLLSFLAHLIQSVGAQRPSAGQQQPGMQNPLQQLLMAMSGGGARQQPQSQTPQSGGGTPRSQGFRGQGGSQIRRSPNQGGYAGPGQSEMSSPGMAHLYAMLGLTPQRGGTMYGSSGLGILPSTMPGGMIGPMFGPMAQAGGGGQKPVGPSLANKRFG